MTNNRDFDALGRYTDARERLTNAKADRSCLAADIGVLLYPAKGGADAPEKLDIVTLQEKFDLLIDADALTMRAAEDVNHFAPLAGKKPLRLY